MRLQDRSKQKQNGQFENYVAGGYLAPYAPVKWLASRTRELFAAVGTDRPGGLIYAAPLGFRQNAPIKKLPTSYFVMRPTKSRSPCCSRMRRSTSASRVFFCNFIDLPIVLATDPTNGYAAMHMPRCKTAGGRGVGQIAGGADGG